MKASHPDPQFELIWIKLDTFNGKYRDTSGQPGGGKAANTSRKGGGVPRGSTKSKKFGTDFRSASERHFCPPGRTGGRESRAALPYFMQGELVRPEVPKSNGFANLLDGNVSLLDTCEPLQC